MIWTDAQLTQWAQDAEWSINHDLPVVWQRTYLPVIKGQSVYTLPSYVRTLSRVTWRGKKLEPLSWDEMQLINPVTVFLSPGNFQNFESSQSKPLYYGMHPTNVYDIRLFPTPNETFAAGIDPYSVTVNEPYCVISYWRSIEPDGDPTDTLPLYILRRTKKAYVAWRAFSAEGAGQNLTAAKYYKQKYDFLIQQFRVINDGVYISKRYALDDGELSVDNYRYPKPKLPSNFENFEF